MNQYRRGTRVRRGNRRSAPRSRLQQFPRFRDAGRRAAVFAGGDAGERDQLPPAEGGAGRGEFLAGRAVELLGVEGAVLADGVLEHQVERGALGVAELAVAVDYRGGVGLEVAADRLLGLI